MWDEGLCGEERAGKPDVRSRRRLRGLFLRSRKSHFLTPEERSNHRAPRNENWQLLLNWHGYILEDLTQRLPRLSRLLVFRLLTSLVGAEQGERRAYFRSARDSNRPQSTSGRSFSVVLCTVRWGQIVRRSCRSLSTGLGDRDDLSGWLAWPHCAFGSNYTAAEYTAADLA